MSFLPQQPELHPLALFKNETAGRKIAAQFLPKFSLLPKRAVSSFSSDRQQKELTKACVTGGGPLETSLINFCVGRLSHTWVRGKLLSALRRQASLQATAVSAEMHGRGSKMLGTSC